MPFEKFEGPFADAEFLGLRDLLCGERIVLDLIECKRTKPPEPPPAGVDENEYFVIEPTDESRVWRLTYDRPFAVKFRDRSLEFMDAPDENWPLQCSFSERSEWINQLVPPPNPTVFVPTHYIFGLLDHVIEILADRSPLVRQIPNIPGS